MNDCLCVIAFVSPVLVCVVVKCIRAYCLRFIVCCCVFACLCLFVFVSVFWHEVCVLCL